MSLFRSSKERNILISTIIFFAAGFLGINIHLASLPTIMKFMHTNKMHMQQSIAVYLFGMGLSMLFYGPLSDKYGRRPIILFGLCFGSLFSFVCMFTQTIHEFLLTRFLQGIGCGVCSGLGRTVISDIVKGDQFAMVASRLNSVGALVPLSAPLIGGYLQHFFGWQANFFALGSYILFSAIIYAIFSEETHLHKNPHAFKVGVLFAHYREILTHRVFVISALLSGIVLSVTMIYAALSPFILQVGFDLSPVSYGWVVSILAVASFLARFVTSPLIRRLGRLVHMQSCIFLFLFVSCLFALFDLAGILGLTAFIALSTMSVVSRAAVGAIFPSYAMEIFPSKKGVAGSLYGSGQMLTAFSISGVVGLFSSDGLSVLVIANLVISCVLVCLSRLFAHKLKM